MPEPEHMEDLRSVLVHLYDPLFEASDLMRKITGCPAGASECVRSRVIQAIHDLEPPPSVPKQSQAWRLYQILNDRYLAQLTQAEVASRLGISDRYLREEQQKAIQLLTKRLCDRAEQDASPGPSGDIAAGQTLDEPDEPADHSLWLSQVRDELDALRKSGQEPLAPIGKIIQDMLEVGRAVTSARDVTLEIMPFDAETQVVAHPQLLRQLILESIRELSCSISGGRIYLQVRQAADVLTIAIEASPLDAEKSLDLTLIKELAAGQGTVEQSMRGNSMALELQFRAPSVADKALVLVVDDNNDLVELYRSYTAQTRYEIVHVGEAQQVFGSIEMQIPDVIVLDVMLPDGNGWKLLAKMHEHPVARAIPIVVCSVVRDEELALALGATLYMPKPVRRRAFLDALDQALKSAASGSLAMRAGTPRPC